MLSFSIATFTDAYIKATLLHRFRRIEKQRGKVAEVGSLSPSFGAEGEFNFDIPHAELDRSTLVLSICHEERENIS